MTLVSRTPIIKRLFFPNWPQGHPSQLSQINNVLKLTDFTLGHGFVILKASDGTLYGFGDNKNGQCGYPDSTKAAMDESSKIEFKSGKRIVTPKKWATGHQFNVAIDENQELYGWGRRSWNQYVAAELDSDNVQKGI